MENRIENVKKVISECCIELNEVCGENVKYDDQKFNRLQNETDNQYYHRLEMVALALLSKIDSYFEKYNIKTDWIEQQIEKF